MMQLGVGVTTVFQNAGVAGPGTHVLIVGIGDYPYLPGGTGSHRTPFDDGMRQLTSPPVSARDFTDWVLTRFDNPRRPLASVQLLLSAADLDYIPPGASADARVRVDLATLDNIRAAVRLLKQRGNSDPENLVMLYFCGHGMSKGEEFAVVARDYGVDPTGLDGLIDLGRLFTGMSDCAARHQTYFIDACRSASATLLDAEGYEASLVARTGRPTPGLAQCVYYSTLGGEAAHARPGQASVYTTALLRALTGAGASNSAGAWRINTSRLFEALSHLMTEFADPGMSRVQVPQSGSQTSYDLTDLPGVPEVSLLVGLAGHGPQPGPAPADVDLTLSQAGAAVASYPPSQPPLSRECEWRDRHFETWLTCGMTDVQLRRPGQPDSVQSHYLTPPGMALRNL